MAFEIFMGEPERLALGKHLVGRAASGKLTADERELFDRWSEALEHLTSNPRHPGLRTHEIDDLSRKFGFKVWQSYLENRRSGARRMFWAYGPQKGQITILALERHPDTGKTGSYRAIPLSRFPAREAKKRPG